jgi:peptidyl-prolyl cis-trans isomerase A (cyclophilin A)
MIRSSLRPSSFGLLLVAASLCAFACKSKSSTSSEPTANVTASAKASAVPTTVKPPKEDPKAAIERRKALLDRLKKKGAEAKPVAKVKVSEGDPENGDFTLAEATQGLAAEGQLIAEIQTASGNLQCELYEDKAPITVATFVGLARGLRPWKKGDKWIKTPLYDGTPFHRVIKGFMIQGGDPEGTGAGGPGFVIPDEIWANAKHDQRGLLCMANRGPNTNGSQFFVMDGAAAHLDGGYTIFGKCSPDTVIEKLASVEVKGDRAVKPVKIRKIVVKRDKSKLSATAPSASGAQTTPSAAKPPAAPPKPLAPPTPPPAVPPAPKPQAS